MRGGKEGTLSVYQLEVEEKQNRGVGKKNI